MSFASDRSIPRSGNRLILNEMASNDTNTRPMRHLARWARSLLSVTLVATLLGLGLANIALRATWSEVDDGVLWVHGPDGVTAGDVASEGPGASAGIRAGDVLLAIGLQPVERPADVVRFLHRSSAGTELRYTILRLQSRETRELTLSPLARGNTALYYVLAAVGIFTLLVGAGVRFRRPGDEATLHFFWVCLAFFGAFTFSFNGRLDRLDWIFYWADAVSMLLLPPLFLHFTLVFPERPRSWVRSPGGRLMLPLLYAPAGIAGVIRIAALARAPIDPRFFASVVAMLDRFDLFHLSAYLGAGLAVLIHAFGHVRSVTARRQLRWIVWGTALGALPFAVGYAIPWSLGFTPSLPMELSALPLSVVPLAFASAIVRYRLMDVEIIVKRALVWAVAVGAIAVFYSLLMRVASEGFEDGGAGQHWVILALATAVVMLLASPVKNAIQAALDRAFYRDRYDYRKALVGFARDLNADLDLDRLGERLVLRVMETLGVDRMVLFLADESSGDFAPLRVAGFAMTPPGLSRRSGLGGRLEAGHVVALDDPLAARRFSEDEIEFWRDWGLFCFVPCISKEGTIAALALGRRDSAEPLSSEDMALLAAVAGQAATALENARLYRQLHTKAAELNRVREFSENILQSLDDGLVVIDKAGQILWWNRAIEHLYGVSAASAIGRRLHDVFDTRFVDAVIGALRDHPDGTTLYRMPLVSHRAADDRLLLNVTVMPLKQHCGDAVEVAGSVLIFDDISARVQLEEQLQVSEKMASIGLLAAGVAHEVNTPLTGIASFTQMLLEGADPEDSRTRLLEKIERQTFRAAKIVNGLLNLSRQGSQGASERGPVDLNAIVNDVLSLLEHQLETGKVKIRREQSPQALVIDGVEHKLQQVFLNLFLNARDAMPRGGWLSVVTRIDSAHALIDVADTGSGIPNEHLSRIYDPFFTTKSIGQGTGLGLSIAYGIIREHDGTIQVESHVGQGTRFTLRLPMSQSFGQREKRA
jgi:PAS domain S-box-containing protein